MNDNALLVHIIFKGRVQGIGFRAKALKFAKIQALKGTVCNLSDGSVEVYAKAPSEKIEEFIQSLKKHFGDNILDIVKEDISSLQKEYTDFQVL
jgi:acylphosphatase